MLRLCDSKSFCRIFVGNFCKIHPVVVYYIKIETCDTVKNRFYLSSQYTVNILARLIQFVVVNGSTHVIFFLSVNSSKVATWKPQKEGRYWEGSWRVKAQIANIMSSGDLLMNVFEGVVAYTLCHDLSVCKQLNQAQRCELSLVNELYSIRRDVILKFQYLYAHACRSVNCAR
jgi:hypothetical protein